MNKCKMDKIENSKNDKFNFQIIYFTNNCVFLVQFKIMYFNQYLIL